MLTSALTLLVMSWAAAAPSEELRMPVQKPSLRAPGCAKNLQLLTRQSVLSSLPVGFRLAGVTLSPVCVPASEAGLRCEAQPPQDLHGGRNAYNVQCVGKAGRRFALAATVELQATVAAKAAVVMARGAEVKIVVRSGNVTVQAVATAQESAGLNETIQVLPSGGTKVVRGRVLDARTVEVTL